MLSLLLLPCSAGGKGKMVGSGQSQKLAGRSPGFVERKLVQAARYGKADDALRLLDELVQQGGQRASSTTAHNNAAAACARAGQYATALSLLHSLTERGGLWDAHSYSTAVTAHGKQGDWERSVELLREMERLAALATPAAEAAGDEPQRAPPPNEFVYGATIGACASAGRWAEAMRLLEQMASRGLPPTTRCYNGALTACDRARQPDAAYSLLVAMRASGRPSSRPDAYSYSAVLASLGRRSGVASSDRVREVLGHMRADGVPPTEHTYGTAALAYGASGSWEHALELLAQMESAAAAAAAAASSSAAAVPSAVAPPAVAAPLTTAAPPATVAPPAPAALPAPAPPDAAACSLQPAACSPRAQGPMGTPP